MNQLLRPPLLKYTNTEKKMHMLKKKNNNDNKKKQCHPLFPRKKGFLQHPTRRSPGRQSRNRSHQLLSQRPPPQRS